MNFVKYIVILDLIRGVDVPFNATDHEFHYRNLLLFIVKKHNESNIFNFRYLNTIKTRQSAQSIIYIVYRLESL